MTERRLVDLSHPIHSGMAVYPNLPSPRIEPLLSHAASRVAYNGLAEFSITRFFMAGNTGTYLDSPWHRFPTAPDVGELELDRLADLDGVRLDAHIADARAMEIGIPPSGLDGKAVLIRSGWAERWGRADYWEPGPFLSTRAVTELVDAGCALIGVDCWNIDDTNDPARPAHTALLEAGILVVEHLCRLEALPSSGFRFFAVPPAIHGAACFPVRAFATVG